MKKNIELDKIIHVFYIVSFLTLVFLRGILNINIPVILITILIFLYMLISKRNVAEILAFLIPFRSVLQNNYIVLFATLIFLFKNRGKVKLKGNIIFLIIVLVIELVDCLNINSSIVDYVTFSISIIYIYLMMYGEFDIKEKVAIIKNNIYGIIISMYLFLFKTLTTVSIDKFIAYKFRLGITDMENYFDRFNLNFDSDEIAFYIVIALALLMFLKANKKINKKMFYLCFVLLFIIGFLTMARAFIIGFALLMLLFLFFSKNSLVKSIKATPIIIIFLFGIYSVNSSFFDSIYSNYAERFKVSDLTNGRTVIFQEYNRVITSSVKKFFIGSGIQNYPAKNNFYITAHNSLQEIFVAWGVIGAISFILFFVIYVVDKVKHNYKNNKALIKYIPILMLLFMLTTIPFFSQGTLILEVYIVMITLGINNSDLIQEGSSNEQNN